METSGNIISRNKGKIALAATLAGTVALGPTACNALEDWLYPESKIVAGVPGQVESHSTGEHCGALLKGTCLRWDTVYYLDIEQCPADVQAAKQGRQTTSFDPKVGEYYTGCNFDYVEVSPDAYQQFPDGATIVFSGNLGDQLQK